MRLSYPSAWMLLGTGSAAPRFWFKWGTFSTVAITSSPSCANFRSLAKEAREAGGDVLVTHGNHEIMNVLGDFRYATKGAYGECARYAAKARAREIAKYGEENVAPLPDIPDGVNPETYMGVLARRQLFLPGGEMAVKMAVNPTVLQVGDTVFAHAGIDSSTVDYGFQRLNDEVACLDGGQNVNTAKASPRGEGCCVDARVWRGGRRRDRRGNRLSPPWRSTRCNWG